MSQFKSKPIETVSGWYAFTSRSIDSLEIHNLTKRILHQNCAHDLRSLLQYRYENIINLKGVKESRRKEIVDALDKLGLKLGDHYTSYCTRHGMRVPNSTMGRQEKTLRDYLRKKPSLFKRFITFISKALGL